MMFFSFYRAIKLLQKKLMTSLLYYTFLVILIQIYFSNISSKHTLLQFHSFQ